jgi:hypothetical protein
VAVAFDAAASVAGSVNKSEEQEWKAAAVGVRAAMLDIMTNATTGGWYVAGTACHLQLTSA